MPAAQSNIDRFPATAAFKLYFYILRQSTPLLYAQQATWSIE